MSNNHISIQQQFFSPASMQQQLHDITPPTSIDRSEMKLLDTAIPSNPIDGHIDREISANQVKFYQEYKRIYNISFNLYEEKKRIQQQVREVLEKVQSIEGKLNSQEQKYKENKSSFDSFKKYDLSSEDNKNRRSRRTAEEIQKKFQCQGHQCQRFYGSEGSLQQHIKLKHPELLRKGEDGSEYSGQEFLDHSLPS